MRVIIAGSRDFNNYALVCATMEELMKEMEITEVVCGCAKGADELGEIWAWSHHINVKRMPAEWDRFGRSAGMIRNHQMGEYADFLVAFWDGKSRGTQDMISYMKKIGKHGRIVKYEN